MIGPVLIGLLAAVAAALPGLVRMVFPSVAWSTPVFVLGIAALAMVLQRFVIDRRPGHRSYDGLADLMIHIHSPASPDSWARWGLRGVISFFLALFGGAAGPEGAAAELTHALAIRVRSRSSRWFEQRRRTDAAAALAAAISAVFSAPFAAVLVPIELEMGGRTLWVAIASLSAFLGTRYIAGLTRVPEFQIGGALYGFHFISWREWGALLALTLLCGVLGMLVIRFVRYSQESLLDLFQTEAWMRTLAGGVLLFLIILVYKGGHLPSSNLLEDVLWARRTPSEVGLLFFTQLLSLALLVSAFGTIGVFWPIFALGGFVGYWVNHTVFQGIAGFSAVSGLAGGAAFWGAVLGTPVAGAVLAYELTQNLSVLLPCLLAGVGARQIRLWLRTHAMVHKDLEARGMSLIEGRSASVLDAVLVRDAMVTDFETVHEQEPVSDLHSRLLKARYPFLPVVNAQGGYLGLLTVDMVQESWQSQDPLASHSPLSRLLEAKDLLYRSGFKPPTVRAHDRLSVTAGVFDEIPCVPVLGDDGKVLGLLFVYNVRLAYDREVARRSLSLHQQPAL